VDWQPGRQAVDLTVSGRAASSARADEWSRRGLFVAMERRVRDVPVFAVRPASGDLVPEALAAAWTQPEIQILDQGDNWPATALIVAEVSGSNPWDEKARLVRKAGGKALIVEIPSSPSITWSRAWFEGKAWPDGVPSYDGVRVPGLIPAREAGALLMEQRPLDWHAPLADPPVRWLEFGHGIAPIALVFLAIAAIYIIGNGVVFALREQKSRFALYLIRLLVIGPAAIVAAGWMASRFSVDSWFGMLVASFGGLSIGAVLLNLAGRRLLPESHPLWGEFAIGMFAVAAFDPAWSMFSHVLGPHVAPVSPEAFGAISAYAVGANCLTGGVGWKRWAWSAVAISGAATLLLLSRWASPLYLAWIPILIAGAGLPLVRNLRTWIPVNAAVGLVSAFMIPGLAYAPHHLVWSLGQAGKFNCAEQIAFLTSPTFIGLALAAVIVGVSGTDFLVHQARRALAFSPQPRYFFFASIGFAVAGAFIPLLLHAALATAIAGGVSVLFDAIRTP
jgi:hypothetical protein